MLLESPVASSQLSRSASPSQHTATTTTQPASPPLAAIMPSRKRPIEAVDEPVEDELLTKIRGMWQFANLCQWIYTFGKAAKIDDAIDVDVSLWTRGQRLSMEYIQRFSH